MSLREDITTIIRNSWDAESGYDFEYADAILALPEVKKMQEKATRCDQILAWDKEHGVDEDNILAWKEKAEKWDRLSEGSAFELGMIDQMNKQRQQLNLLMSGLVVEEKCGDGQFDAEDCLPCKRDCYVGILTRPARVEEVKELLDSLKFACLSGKYRFTLKSGAILRMEAK